MEFIYNIAIRLFGAGISLAAPFHRKAKLLARGRKGLLPRIERELGAGQAQKPTLWMHCASLGEFEQGRPLLEAFRAEHPHWRIVLTFFSPSGYEVRKNYAGADHIFYLPADIPQNARRFVRAVQPRLALFVKYEYWFNYLNELKRAGVPSAVVSAIFRPADRFFKPRGGFARKTLRLVGHFFVQDQRSAELLTGIGIEQATVSGDTRFDRVLTLAQAAPSIPLIRAFAQGSQPVLVCGSTWPDDEAHIMEYLKQRPGVKCILVPHEIHPDAIDRLIAASGRQGVRYTQANAPEELAGTTLLVVDTIGLLSGIYSAGTVAYVGGGFGRGIHNTLEAAVWGIPVVFGPNYHAFAEAEGLIAQGAARSVDSGKALEQTLDGWFPPTGEQARQEAGDRAAQFVRSRAGATRIILDHLGIE